MKTQAHVALALVLATAVLKSDTLALVAADASDYASGAQAALLATGKFTQVDVIDAQSSTPSITDLSGYTDVLAWTNLFPANGTALGNVLAQFYDIGGKHLTI